MARPSRYPLELRRRAVRMVAEVRDDYPNEAAALQAVAEQLDIGSRETLRNWVKQHEIDGGQRPAAGKLLARKRPRLLPVYDQAVRCILGRPKSFWLDLRGALRADNHAPHRELMVLRQAADIPASVSALRVCDVVPWMHHRTDHQQRSCIGT